MIRLLALSAALALSGCTSTVETVRLNSGKALLTAQIALRAAQQTTLALCSPPTRPAQCPVAIDVLHQGALAENAAITAQRAGNAADLQTALVSLTALPAQLVALGILKAD